MKIAIVGGGAAGFFLAANIRKTHPHTEVIIFEKAAHTLAKVKVSGGGRCNLTNSFQDITDLKQAYPRGFRLMKKLFNTFNHKDAYEWFEQRGVALTTQEDQCVFPVSQDSESIILCLKREAQKQGVIVRTKHLVERITPQPDGTYCLSFGNRETPSYIADRVAITTGGAPLPSQLQFIDPLQIETEYPVPSLYSFTINNSETQALMGIVAEQATTSICGTKFKSHGALLITHWGMSGPAILKLSSYAARWIHEQNYRFTLQVCWTTETNTEQVAQELKFLQQQHAQKQLSSVRPYGLQQRLWLHLIQKADLLAERKWAEIGKKGINKLATLLTADEYKVEGKGANKQEFVTCGGIKLDAISHQTLESKTHPGLFFAGEVLDIDAITGGFNLQAAWTTGYIIAQHIAD